MSEKHHGILMSDPMIRAYVAGRKGQTRRTRGLDQVNFNPGMWEFKGMVERDGHLCFHFSSESGLVQHFPKSPYGKPGDRLRFRETWRPDDFAPDDVSRTIYHADVPLDVLEDTEGIIKWHPSLLIPNARTRFHPKLISVRAERLQHISEADAIAEGFPDPDGKNREFPDRARYWYHQLWDELNGAGSWDKNEWVGVYEFERFQP